jgi:1-acyl-sn-glycerol-3-phosphate acyltransferase
MIKIIRALVNIYFSIFYKIKISGLENIPGKGAAILCSNHIGQLDMFFIGYKSKRLIHYMAKEELFRNPILSKIITYLGAFPVKRSFADVSMFRNVFKILEEGHIIGIFPEGTRMRDRSRESVKIKSGAALFAHEASVPIIPVAISGEYRLFGRIKINIGMPFMLPDSKNKKASKEDLADMSKLIMNKIYKLMEEK